MRVKNQSTILLALLLAAVALALVILLFTYGPAQAQRDPAGFGEAAQWVFAYGGAEDDSANDILVTEAGDYMVAGRTGSFGAEQWDGWLLALDENGSLLWQKRYGGELSDEFQTIRQTDDGGYIAGGSMGSGNAWLLKLDASGEIEWQLAYGGGPGNAYFSRVLQTSDGGFVATGSTSQSGKGLDDFWLMKLGPAGNILWQETIGTSNSDWASDVVQSSDGGFVVAGGIGDTGDPWITKFAGNGGIVWQTKYDPPGGGLGGYASAILGADDGGFYVAGNLWVGVTGAWVMKIDSDGVVEWQKVYGDVWLDHANDIQSTSDGGFIVAGMRYGILQGDNCAAWLIKLDDSGNVLWEKAYRIGVECRRFAVVAQAGDGGYVAIGSSYEEGVDEELFVWKVDEAGEITDCDHVHEVSSQVRDGGAVFVETTATPEASTAMSTATSVSPQGTAATALLLCGPKLAITKDGPPLAVAGDPITYQLEARNVSTDMLTGIVISDVLPLGAHHVAGGTLVGDVVSWALPTLDAGQVVSRSFVVTASETITNEYYAVSSSEGERGFGTRQVVTIVETEIADLSAENDGPTRAGSATTLTATISAGSNVHYSWAFGDGAAGVGKVISHTYAGPGFYTAVVTAANTLGSLTAWTVVEVKEADWKIYAPIVIQTPVSAAAPSPTAIARSSSWEMSKSRRAME